MIGISRLYCGSIGPQDALRYGRAGAERKPVVVFNCTRRCSLRCPHCYSDSGPAGDADELTTDQAKTVLDDLADFGVPAVLFSGGEPLERADWPALLAHARAVGLRTALSTNGTRIDAPTADRLAEAGVGYVGVSLDGLEAAHDRFRGQAGAFDAALAGIRRCRARGIRVGLRLTMTRDNADELGGIFDLIERESIGRVCFYHLVGAGRGAGLGGVALSHEQTRAALDLILDRTAALAAAGRATEVLTVDNHADGAYLVLRLSRQDGARAASALALLRANGGNGSGVSIGCVSWNGHVHADQFWRQRIVGNVLDRPFSRIWSDPPAGSLLDLLRRRRGLFSGRCRRCRWLDICNGNLRCRADQAGQLWGDDPACYLSEKEITGKSGDVTPIFPAVRGK